jgi:hypothetical protein
MLVVVIDINGVLGDVRRLYQACSGRTPDVFLCESSQVFYLRPGAKEFLKRLKAIPGISLILWTSRLRRNAAPIEAELKASQFFHATMHGEDCFDKRDSFHPVKDVRTIRRYYAEIRNATIAFLDNKPQYLNTDTASFFIPCGTYDAAKNREAEEEERKLSWLAEYIEDVAEQCNSSTATA